MKWGLSETWAEVLCSYNIRAGSAVCSSFVRWVAGAVSLGCEGDVLGLFIARLKVA